MFPDFLPRRATESKAYFSRSRPCGPGTLVNPYGSTIWLVYLTWIVHCISSSKLKDIWSGRTACPHNTLSFSCFELEAQIRHTRHISIKTDVVSLFTMSIRLQNRRSNAQQALEGMFCADGFGGAYRDRTDDPLLAKQVLSQLS